MEVITDLHTVKNNTKGFPFMLYPISPKGYIV